MKPGILLLRPDYDPATRWGAYWAKELLLSAGEKLNYRVIDLYGDDGREPPFSSKVLEEEVVLISGVCHGMENLIVGQGGQVILRKGDLVTKRLARGKFWSILSCLAGKELFPWMVEEGGATATMGYEKKFWFCISEFPNDFAKPFFESHFAGENKLLQGGTVKESFDWRISVFSRYLADPNVPEKIKPFLLRDKNCAVVFGDLRARISIPTPIEYVLELPRKLRKFDIVIKVIDKGTKEPLPEAIVRMAKEVDRSGYREATTNEEGKASFSDVEEGRYLIAGLKEGYRSILDIIQVPKEEQ